MGTYQFSESTDGASAQDVKVNVGSFSASDGTGRTVASSTSKGSEAEQDVWSSKSVLITTSTLSDSGASAKCTWAPAITELMLPLTKGETTSSTGTCTVKDDGFTINVKRDMTSKVIGQTVVAIGGQSVTTWVVSRVDNLTLSGSGLASTVDTNSTEDFDPTFGMVVKSRSVAKTQAAFEGKTQKSTHTVTEIATSLKPS